MSIHSSYNPSELTLVVQGTTAVVPCVAFTLYLDGVDAEGILDFYQRARAACGPRLTHYIAESMKRRAAINARAESMIPTWVRNPTHEKAYFFHASGCDEVSGVSDSELEFRIFWRSPPTEALLARRRSNWRTLYAQGAELFLPMTMLRVSLPLQHPLAGEPDSLIEWVVGFSLVQRGVFVSGTCGYALNHYEGASSSPVRAAMIQRLAAICRRYPGVEWSPPPHAIRRLLRWDVLVDDIVPQITRVSWLTLIGPASVRRLGGPVALSAAVSTHPEVRVHTVDGGAIVQAGGAPCFGSPTDTNQLSAYRVAASTLRPLRMPFILGPSGSREEWVDEWQQALDKPAG